jgi:hypothetical protein
MAIIITVVKSTCFKAFLLLYKLMRSKRRKGKPVEKRVKEYPCHFRVSIISSWPDSLFRLEESGVGGFRRTQKKRGAFEFPALLSVLSDVQCLFDFSHILFELLHALAHVE